MVGVLMGCLGSSVKPALLPKLYQISIKTRGATEFTLLADAFRFINPAKLTLALLADRRRPSGGAWFWQDTAGCGFCLIFGMRLALFIYLAGFLFVRVEIPYHTAVAGGAILRVIYPQMLFRSLPGLLRTALSKLLYKSRCSFFIKASNLPGLLSKPSIFPALG